MDRKPKGRSKIKMQKIESKAYLQATFTKRKYGVFKKASELGILCGANAAIIVFSPGGKAFSFGHPSVDHVVDKFLGVLVPEPNDLQLEEHDRNARIEELNIEYEEAVAKLEAAKIRGKMLAETGRKWQEDFRWLGPLEQLDSYELERMLTFMKEFEIRLLQEPLQDPVPVKALMSANQMDHPRHGLLTQGPPVNQIQNLDSSCMAQNHNIAYMGQDAIMYRIDQKPNIAPPMFQNVDAMVQNHKRFVMEQNLNLPPMGS